jgi:hypothetical protein
VTTRDPPAWVKQLLRQEVNFGCPVRNTDGTGCGCPVLTYHHFDPPWALGHQHDPAGMIALCPGHHDEADGGRWTKQTLRSFKTNPYVDSRIRCPWSLGSEKLLVRAGPGLVVGQGSPLRLYGKPIFGFRIQPVSNLDVDTVVFDSYIENRAGAPWMKIEDGSFDLATRSTRDLHWPPQMRHLSATNKDGTNFKVRFNKVAARKFPAWWHDFNANRRFGLAAEFLSKHDVVDSDGHVPIMSLTGAFSTNHVAVRITGRKMTVQSLMPGWANPGGLVQMTGNIVDAEHYLSLAEGETKTEYFRFG